MVGRVGFGKRGPRIANRLDRLSNALASALADIRDPADAVFLHLGLESRAAQPEQPRRLGLIATRHPQGLCDEQFIHTLKEFGVGGGSLVGLQVGLDDVP